MNSYEEKMARRKEKLEAAAQRADARAKAAYERADLREEKTGIPLGQPILVGHHSERRHRRVIERAHAAMDESVSQNKRAEQLREKAANVGAGGISSDDPNAIEKLEKKLAKLQDQQSQMKFNNRILKKWVKKGVSPDSEGALFEECFAELKAINPAITMNSARLMLKPDSFGYVGHAPFELTNNNAKIRSTAKRIKQLRANQNNQTSTEIVEDVCKIVFNVEENRVQIIFQNKPNQSVRMLMKSHGFRWAPSRNAWQRQLTNNARYAAKLIMCKLKK
ncbi:DUF3560 domain-containing protein [Hirschia litorea]|uniref:DUF3560 domain-containing protein n=1 Tax=Hirschia litorea TaxID=1199156 RepID=A0ABW2IQD3_9PROT